MLRPGFLGTLAEWVGGEYNRRVKVMDKAAKRFGLQDILAEVSEEEKARSIIGLFSEWLVFDYHCDHFGGKTGFEFFLIHNRHALSEVDWCAYHEMLAFEVGLFEVLRVEPGRGLMLRSLQNGTERFVEDVSISLSGEPHITLWARIAPVGGIYHIVSHVVRSLPVRFGDGMIKEIRAQKKNTYDAKFAAGLQMKNEEEHDSENLISEQPPSAAQARRAFKEALAYCGMDTFFTLRRFNTWLDEKNIR